jgi:hypothetical protein
MASQSDKAMLESTFAAERAELLRTIHEKVEEKTVGYISLLILNLDLRFLCWNVSVGSGISCSLPLSASRTIEEIKQRATKPTR